MKHVLITGCSSGIGNGLCNYYLQQGDRVTGISRSVPKDLINHDLFRFIQLDLTEFEDVVTNLKTALTDCQNIDVVILNAGILGNIADLKDSTIEHLKHVMDTNLWSNKVFLDTLCDAGISTKKVVAMSSGASVNGNRGWSGYSLSKSALNMLMKLYAAENPETLYYAFAPGLIDTPMQDYLNEEVDEEKFTSVKRIKAARNTPGMLSPEEAAPILAKGIAALDNYDNGSFVDVRKM